MKVAMITPHYDPPVRGNAITVRRIAATISSMGCTVRVFSLDATGIEEICEGIGRFRPDVVHAFHGCHGGRVALAAARLFGVPFVVTLTGTDLYDLGNGGKEELGMVFRKAAAVVVFGPSMKKAAEEYFPGGPKLRIIPQGVDLQVPELVRPAGRAEEFIFLLPAGIRPVKNVLFPLAPLAELHRHDPRVRFVVVGPVIDPAYASSVLAELEKHPFTRYLGVVDHHAMGNLYLEADVVLNSSLFEGGMANSLLEALALGRPVLAAKIVGNRSLIEEGKTGLLYRDEREFLEKAGRLLQDRELRKRLGERGKEFVASSFSAGKEAAAYVELYREVLQIRLKR